MKINVNKALIADAERKAKPTPVPTIRLKVILERPSGKILISGIESNIPSAHNFEPAVLPAGAAGLEQEMHALVIQRKKLSTRTAAVVQEVCQRLTKNEGANVAAEFINGNIAARELREHYAKIQAITDQVMALYDRIDYVKQNGQLPPSPAGDLLKEDNPDVSAITHEIRRLDDMIYKTLDKITKANGGLRQPKNSERINTWRTKIAMAEAKRDDLKLKRKQLRNGSRE